MPPWTGSYRRRRPQARRATAVTIFSAAAAATARAARWRGHERVSQLLPAAARDGAALVVLAARPRQAGQRCPDTARSVQKVEARTGPPLLAKTCCGPRGAHRSPPRRLQCAPLRRSTHGFTERYYAADFGTQAMLLLCIVVVASVRSLAIYATHFGLSGLVASVLGR